MFRSVSFTAPLLAAMMLLLCGCQRVTEADKAAAIETVKQNIAAMQAENMEAMAATIHSQSPHFERSKMQTEAIFKIYDLHYTLKNLAIQSATPDTIRISFEQVTVKLRGPEEFQNSRFTGVHVLKKENGAWKLWSIENPINTPLDDEPEK